MPALAAPGPPALPSCASLGPPVPASGHSLWLAGEGWLCGPHLHPRTEMSAPMGGAQACWDMHLCVRRARPPHVCSWSWEGGSGKRHMAAAPSCRHSVDQQRLRSPSRAQCFLGDVHRVGSSHVILSDLMCGRVYPQIHMSSVPCLWARLLLRRSSQGSSVCIYVFPNVCASVALASVLTPVSPCYVSSL